MLAVEMLLGTCGSDAEALRGMYRDLQVFAPLRLREVNDALRQRDALALREAAHKLGGILSAFSEVAGNLAFEVEGRAVASIRGGVCVGRTARDHLADALPLPS